MGKVLLEWNCSPVSGPGTCWSLCWHSSRPRPCPASPHDPRTHSSGVGSFLSRHCPHVPRAPQDQLSEGRAGFVLPLQPQLPCRPGTEWPRLALGDLRGQERAHHFWEGPARESGVGSFP